MADLFNQQISATYSGLLKTTSNGVLSSSLAQITDGNGNDSPLSMSTTEIQFNTGSNTFKFPTTRGTIGQILKISDTNGTLDWVADASGDVTKTGTIALNTIAVWNDNADELRSDTTMSINTNHTISLSQTNSNDDDVSSYNIGGGNIANVTGQNNTGFGQSNMQRVTTGANNVAFGNSTLDKLTTGSNNTVIGNSGLFSLTEGDGNTGVGQSSLDDVTTGSNNTAIGKYSGSAITTGSNNVILGSNTGSTINTSSNNIIISDGSGNNRIQVDSGGNVGIGTTTFASTTNLQLKIGNMGSGIVGEIFDAVDNADNSRLIICGGGTGTPQFSMRHYSASYGFDMWLNTSTPYDIYIDNRNPSSGFIFRNNCNNDGSENELMRITSGGNVGIGSTSPTSGYSGTTKILEVANGNAAILSINNTAQIKYQIISDAAGSLTFWDDTNNATRLKILSGGGQESTNSGNDIPMWRGYHNQSSPYGVRLTYTNNVSNTDNWFIYCETNNSTPQFKVTSNGFISARSTSITSLSDRNLKENIKDLNTGLNEVLNLKPRSFDWKEGWGEKNQIGFIAQEVEEVLPNLVGEWKKSHESKEFYKSLTQGDMLPTLVKAIQEQQTIIEDLKSRIETLEG